MTNEQIIKTVVDQCRWFFGFEFKKITNSSEQYSTTNIRENKCCIFGDSRVAGGDWSKVKNTYPLDNKGIGGTDFSGWARYEAIQYLIAKNYKEIIIALGGNDLAAGHSDQKILGNLQKIIFALKKYTQSNIYVHCILPIWEHGKAKNSDVIRVNKLMKKLCSINRVPFVDFEDNFSFINHDGEKYINPIYLNLTEVPVVLWSKIKPVHLNQEGYNLWYKLLEDYLNG